MSSRHLDGEGRQNRVTGRWGYIAGGIAGALVATGLVTLGATLAHNDSSGRRPQRRRQPHN
jgi:hypothetical protein